MREIDFLPDWYPQIQRRYRTLIVQAWASAIIIVALCVIAAAKRLQVHNATAATVQCEAQIKQSQQKLVQLAEKIKFQDQLLKQDQILAKIGVGVDSTRLLQTLEESMSPEMALTDLSLETVEQPRSLLATTGQKIFAVSDSPEVDRRLKVTVDGVAPNDTESAALYANLLKVACFDNVTLQYMRPGGSRDGHLTREFEITFDLSLNAPTEATK